ncbi:MAG TPA: LLM class F420-dependent oxidoreductase [Acidimicrobiales bacterium]|nr:LLM class F420-dependent oxidoreductase [Acidimicrobiales bacterium]
MALVTRFGLQIPSFTYPESARAGGEPGLFEQVATIATTAEEAGFDSLWVMDHLFQIPMVGTLDEPMFESYTLLGALAARTRRARLGAMVTGVTYRNPALLAKQVTAIDVISRGRAVLGIGAAWFDTEHQGLGFAFPPLSERFERLEEALRICRAMFTEDAPSFEGHHYRIDRAVNRPRPVQAGGPPILVGGSGERKTLRLVARYADACNLFGSVEEIRHKLDVLRRHCDDAGRDYDVITKTKLATLIIASSAAEVDRLVADTAARRGVDPDVVRAFVVAGDPDAVVAQVAQHLDAGLDGMVFNMQDAYDLDHLRLAGKTLTEAFGSRDD